MNSTFDLSRWNSNRACYESCYWRRL